MEFGIEARRWVPGKGVKRVKKRKPLSAGGLFDIINHVFD
jgi:hypothetical protein